MTAKKKTARQIITGLKIFSLVFHSKRKSIITKMENELIFFPFGPCVKPEYYLKLITETGVFKYVSETQHFEALNQCGN